MNTMPVIFNKTNQSYPLIVLLVTAAHVAVILLGLFSFNARSERGAQITMMTSLIDNPSTEISKNTSIPKLKNSVSKNHTSSDLEKSSNSQEDERQEQVEKAGASPVTMPNPYAKGLDNPKPPYPMMSRRLNEEGKVVLNVCVSLSGLVENLKLEKTSGYQRLDDIAIETVKKWKFIPAKTHDRDINACYLLPVQFILRKERSRLNG